MRKNIITQLQRSILVILFCNMFCLNAKTQTYSTPELKPALNDAILRSKQGSVIELPEFLSERFPLITYQKIILPGPQYLISDEPEYIRVPEAIVLQENVQPGSVRLYMYNVNGVKDPIKMVRKISPVIKNTGTQIMHLRMLKYSSQKPSSNYFQIGKQGLTDYFSSAPSSIIQTINPGQAAAIDPQMEKNIVQYDELAHGLYEFVIDQPGEINILQTDPNTTGPQALNRIKTILPSDSHVNAGRGTFGVCNYLINTSGVYDTKDGTKQILIADGELDPWITGIEKNSGHKVDLSGNYGVMYNIEMKWKSTDGKALALVIWNAKGESGQWCNGMAASMITSKGKYKDGIIQLPSDRLITTKAPEAILVQLFLPSKNGEEQTIKLTYSPPGASCLPTPLVFIPVTLK